MSGLGKPKEDEVAYMLEVDDDSMRWRITLFSGRSCNLEEFVQAMETFCADARENPEELILSESSIASEFN
jgi:hypothetical protein